MRIGLPMEYFIEGINRRSSMPVKQAVRLMEKHGAQVVQVSLPHTKVCLAGLLPDRAAEASANLARFDGVRYGLRVPQEDLIPMYASTRARDSARR
jgi:aspartyl-tRNA(Asn)/glutamyl-tRNA(Gln) amidotransferase subunit A